MRLLLSQTATNSTRNSRIQKVKPTIPAQIVVLLGLDDQLEVCREPDQGLVFGQVGERLIDVVGGGLSSAR
jgi:hypothetical protein